jgi:hypothetical protein
MQIVVLPHSITFLPGVPVFPVLDLVLAERLPLLRVAVLVVPLCAAAGRILAPVTAVLDAPYPRMRVRLLRRILLIVVPGIRVPACTNTTKQL